LNFFETSTRNLLRVEADAGVGHHVALSVVGADRLPDSGYMRAKVAQEALIRTAAVPYTIVRATQFFEFLGAIAGASTDGGTVRLPPARMQPIAADDVAAALADVAVGTPVNGIVEVAGPEPLPMDELVRRFLSATDDARPVIADARARYFGAALNDSSLVPGDNPRLGSTRFERWLSQFKRDGSIRRNAQSATGALSTCRAPLLHGKVAAWTHCPPPSNIRITGSLSKSLAMRCGCTSGSV
jgi:uncharacterized protein YbjT (DUF2867 family)